MHEKEIRGTKIYVARAQRKSERLAYLRREFEKRKKAMQEKYQVSGDVI